MTAMSTVHDNRFYRTKESAAVERVRDAAPELLEALEDLVSDVERQMKNPSHHEPFSYRKALAAIAKATGAAKEGE